MKAHWEKYRLRFKRAAGTSRGTLTEKTTYFIYLENTENKGIGECNLFQGLSADDLPDYEEKLDWLCENIHLSKDIVLNELTGYPSIIFGYEQVMSNFKEGKNIYFPSNFTEGKDSIKINGLIWMGSVEDMRHQIQTKIEQGFSCIKMKIGAIKWKEEKTILKELRTQFPKEQIELRVDANGAFSAEEAKRILDDLAELEIHSIEQPIRAGQWKAMERLCKNTPTPIALDEELIGLQVGKEELLKVIQPQYIILKPTLIGGFSGAQNWIDLAEKHHIGWWITSALESNIGLNALAQWTYQLKNLMPQGLGTGELFENNFPSPLYRKGEYLYYHP